MKPGMVMRSCGYGGMNSKDLNQPYKIRHVTIRSRYFISIPSLILGAPYKRIGRKYGLNDDYF